MSKSAPLVFFGTEDFSAVSLEALIKDGWLISAVITKPDAKSGRGQKLVSPKVKRIADNNGIAVLQPDSLSEGAEEIKKTGARFGVLVAYGKIIPKSIIDLFPGGIINIHPSLLPKYRGPSPIEAVILNGDGDTAISLMKLTPGMDEGPVYIQERIELDGTEDRLSLNQIAGKLGAELLIKHLPQIIDDSLIPSPQNNAKATYTKLLKKEDGLTDWQEPAEVIERKVRAYLGFPKLRANIFGHEVVITKSRVVKNINDGDLVVTCNPGWLEIKELIAPSGRSMSGAEFLRGYKKP